MNNSADTKSSTTSKRKKTEIAVAATLTAILMTSAPILAWFTNQRNAAKLAKIKAPSDLYINAAHREDIIHLDMRTVDVMRTYTYIDENDENKEKEAYVTSQDYVFCVSGEWVNSFILQMEYTTNNPYTYTIYEADWYTSEAELRTNHGDYNTLNPDGSPKYVTYITTNDFDDEEASKVDFEDDEIDKDTTLYIYRKNAISGRYLNKDDDSRKDDGTLTYKSYDRYTNMNDYVDPVYWQSNSIAVGGTKGEPFYKTFIVNVSWSDEEDIAEYKKETDIIYISAFV